MVRKNERGIKSKEIRIKYWQTNIFLRGLNDICSFSIRIDKVNKILMYKSGATTRNNMERIYIIGRGNNPWDIKGCN